MERGDPPMGVAFGEFTPAHAYATIQRTCVDHPTDQSALNLSVQMETGQTIPCAGVGIQDGAAELDAPNIFVEVLGIEYPLYEQLFPEHVIAYQQQFV
jgi:hypothetical protein